MNSTPKVVVVGAGIGGLTAAAALLRAGCEVEVHERAPALHPVGAGITVQTNAMKALSLIELDGPIADAGQAMEGGGVQDRRGRDITRIDAELTRKLEHPQIAIHRADLQRVLLDRVGAERVHTGRRCVGYELADDGAVARFEGGDGVKADLVIGADGIHSAVRAQLLGEVEPRYAGYTCWRGTCPGGDALWEPRAAVERWGAGARFGIVPIGGGRIYWFATHDAPRGGEDAPGEAKKAVAAVFEGWASPVPELIAGTPEESILRNDIVDRPPVDRWGEGRVTLLGDAAHAMTPNMGQGGCQAIEDAVVLGHVIAGAGDLEAALREYERRRRSRANWFVEQSFTLGSVAQWSAPPARIARDLGMRLMGRFAARSMRRAWTFDLGD